MGRGDNVRTGSGQRNENITDSRHTGIQSRHTQRTCNGPDAFLEILNSRIGYPRIGMIGRASAKSLFHGFRRVEFISSRIVYRHGKRMISIFFIKRSMQKLCFKTVLIHQIFNFVVCCIKWTICYRLPAVAPMPFRVHCAGQLHSAA